MNDLTLFEHWKQCWTKDFANFDGRARRREFWGFMLFNFIFLCVIYILFIFILSLDRTSAQIGGTLLYVVSVLINIVILIPSLAAIARRLHDTGRSAWWYLLTFIPLIGFYVLIAFFCGDSQRGENKWGPNPKEPNLHQ